VKGVEVLPPYRFLQLVLFKCLMTTSMHRSPPRVFNLLYRPLHKSKNPYGSFLYAYPTGLWSSRVYLCRGSVILSL
jgi:hypothetical protein